MDPVAAGEESVRVKVHSGLRFGNRIQEWRHSERKPASALRHSEWKPASAWRHSEWKVASACSQMDFPY